MANWFSRRKQQALNYNLFRLRQINDEIINITSGSVAGSIGPTGAQGPEGIQGDTGP